MKLLTKAKLASEITLSSLFMQGGTVDFSKLQKKSHRYCTGTYKRTLLNSHHDFPVPVWYESRTDLTSIFKDERSYIVLRCVQESRLTVDELAAYKRAIEVWNEMKTRDAQAV